MSSVSRWVVMAFVVVLLCLIVLTQITVSSADPEDPPSELGGIWGGFPRMLVEVSPVLGEVRNTDQDVGFIYRLTLDPDRRQLWLLNRTTLGSNEAMAPVNTADPESSELAVLLRSEHQALSADAEQDMAIVPDVWMDIRHVNGESIDRFRLEGAWAPGVQAMYVDRDHEALWLVGLLHVYRYTLDGDHVRTVPTGRLIRDSALDRERGRLWLAMGRELAAFDDAAEKTLSVSLDSANQARLVAYEPGQDRLRVVAGDQLRRYDVQGNLLASAGDNWFRQANFLAAADDGRIWVADHRRLRLYDVEGRERLLEEEPFSQWFGARIDNLTVDRLHGLIWLSNRNQLRAFNEQGDRVHSVTVEQGRFGAARLRDLVAYWDEHPPELTVIRPEDGAFTNTPLPVFELTYENHANDVDPDSLRFVMDGQPLEMDCDADSVAAQCVPIEPFDDGTYEIEISVANAAGARSEAVPVAFTIDTVPPAISLTQPGHNSWTNEPVITIAGSTDKLSDVLINGQLLELDEAFSFETEIQLAEGENEIQLRAEDLASNVTEKTVVVNLDTTPPGPVNPGLIHIVAPDGDGNVHIEGEPGSAEPGSTVLITNSRTGESVEAHVHDDGSFSADIPGQAGDRYEITVRDRAGNESETIEVDDGGDLPPDPSLVAPELDKTVPTPMHNAVSFLWEGANPIQRDVDPAVFEPHRIAVLRGRVLDWDGEPLAGAKIQILGKAHFGHTLSRSDGRFDLAVNGGGPVVVEYLKEGYLPLQRRLTPGWEDWAHADDIVLTPLDPKVTTIDMGPNAPQQVAAGQVVEDADGSRQATVVFPEGVTAEMELPDGTTQPLDSLDFRATEYTVGENGPAAMPGELPRQTAYTYAVELSVDQAIEAGAEHVRFSQPLAFYVDNFLDFPTGGYAPAGWYDREKAAWIPSDNGRVIELLATEGDQAVLDVSGDGEAATEEELAELGIDAKELGVLAARYAPGDSLWRTPIDHFTAWDINWNWIFPEPLLFPPELEDVIRRYEDDCTRKCGSIIEAENQAVIDQVSLGKEGVRLNYTSRRATGDYRTPRTVNLTVTGNSVDHDDLVSSYAYLRVAGQVFTQNVSLRTDQQVSFTWDGLDAYGRPVVGEAPAEVGVVYVYRLKYVIARQDRRRVFGAVREAGASMGGRDRSANTGEISKTEDLILQSPYQPLGSIGQWTLDGHHRLGMVDGVIETGDGRRFEQSASHLVVEPVMVNSVGEDIRRYEAGDPLGDEEEFTFADDGSILFGSRRYLVRLSPEGHLDRVSEYRFPSRIRGVAIGENGEYYISTSRLSGAGSSESARVYRISPDGDVERIAGGGNLRDEEVDALEARFGTTQDLYALSDGGLIFRSPSYTFRWFPDGRLTRIGGGFGMRAVGPDDRLYTGNHFGRVSRRTDNGESEIVAGGGSEERESGLPATDVRLGFGVSGIAPDEHGGFYLGGGAYIYYVDGDGILQYVAGSEEGSLDPSVGEQPAHSVRLSPDAIRLGPDGNVYFSSTSHPRALWRLRSNVPSADEGVLMVPDPDGREIYEFDTRGRHLSTLDGLTGEQTTAFEYDDDGRLIRVNRHRADDIVIDWLTDTDGVIRVGSVAHPFQLDEEGHITRLENTAEGDWDFSYSPGGLILAADRNDQLHYSRSYDSEGLLLETSDAREGGWSLENPIASDDRLQVSLVSAEDRRTVASAESRGGDKELRRILPWGGESLEVVREDRSRTRHHPDGTVVETTMDMDQRLGSGVERISRFSLTLPSGLEYQTEVERESIGPGEDWFDYDELRDRYQVNGRLFESSFYPEQRRHEHRTPAGRETVVTSDASGRPVATAFAGLTTELEWDDHGRIVSARTRSGEEERAITLEYQAMEDGGDHVTVQRPIGNPMESRLDEFGRVLWEDRGDGNRIHYDYDMAGNLARLEAPHGSVHRFEYDAGDLETGYLPPDLDGGEWATYYRYNLDRDLTRITRPDGKIIDLEYDDGGRLSAIQAPVGRYDYHYHAGTEQLSRVDAPAGIDLGLEYDGFLPVSESWDGPVSGTVSRSWDENLWMQALTIDGQTVDFGYDDDGLMTRAADMSIARELETGMVDEIALGETVEYWNYGPFQALSGLTTEALGESIFQVDYERDAMGRITSKTETTAEATRSWTYHYDEAGRLETVYRDGSVYASYQYDANGNRLSRTGPNGTETGSYDDQDRLLTYGARSYEYSRNGELQAWIEAGTRTEFDYDAFGNLRHVNLPGDVEIDYLIDGRNRRVGKQVNGELVQGFLYQDHLNPVAELDGDGNVVSYFIYATRPNVPDYMIRDGERYRIIADHLGSVRLVIHADTGEIVQRLDYDAFGRVLEDTNPGFQPFGFAGGIYDQHTGMVRFGARDYDPKTGRWTAKDPIRFYGDGPNLYGYVLNDSVNALDPEGLFSYTLNLFKREEHHVPVRDMEQMRAVQGGAGVMAAVSSAGAVGAVGAGGACAVAGTSKIVAGTQITLEAASILGPPKGVSIDDLVRYDELSRRERIERSVRVPRSRAQAIYEIFRNAP
ncbi:RHS repeat-associated protein [Natronospira proteinivora]|uniref:RHS repeat-associated protein n=1 Tax=Natronospira proteinivora TaxID=1807133 RepID=A0ABT1GAL5_9GAMM|nr:RHS repeat-associated core domain-containing protein [Natronospira proteinivora]MCP1727353.1 RHS repeat-associated protein [Natronospira proteinivora]